MDQYIYKTFKMLENGLYWSFYCCSSIWIFVQIVTIRCPHHNLQVSGRGFWSWFQMDKASAHSLHQHRRTSRPHSTWRLNSLPVQLKDKKELNESSRRLFFFLPSIIYHSASEHKIKSGKKKKDLCEREANQELW